MVFSGEKETNCKIPHRYLSRDFALVLDKGGKTQDPGHENNSWTSIRKMKKLPTYVPFLLIRISDT